MLKSGIYPNFLYILDDWSGITTDNNTEAISNEMSVVKCYVLGLSK